MKRLLILLLALSLVFSLAACGDKPEEAEKEDPVVEEAEEEEVVEEIEEEKKVEEKVEEEVEEEEAEVEEEEEEESGGEAFVASVKDLNFSSYTISPQWYAFEEPLIAENLSKNYIALSGDDYYILADGSLLKYKLVDEKLVFEEEISLEEDYEWLSSDSEGRLYLSRFMKDFVRLDGGDLTILEPRFNKVTMHPSGEWGIAFFTGKDVQ